MRVTYGLTHRAGAGDACPNGQARGEMVGRLAALFLMLTLGVGAAAPALAQSDLLEIERQQIGPSDLRAETQTPAEGPPAAPSDAGDDVEYTEPGNRAEDVKPVPILHPTARAARAAQAQQGPATAQAAPLQGPVPAQAAATAAASTPEAATTPVQTARAAAPPARSNAPTRTSSARNGPSSPTLAAILNRGTLRVGTSLFAPYAMRDALGDLIGHEVDVALALAQTLDVELEMIPVEPDALIEDLKSGRFDIAIAALAITPERALEVHFTTPYGTSGVQLVATEDIADDNDRRSDFNDEDMVIGVAIGSIAEQMSAKHFPQAQIVRYPDPQQAQSALLNGDVDVIAAASPFPEVLVAQAPDRFALPLKDPLHQVAEGMAIRQGDPEFLAFLNAWITAHTMDEFLPRTRAYWLDSTDWLSRLTQMPRIERGGGR